MIKFAGLYGARISPVPPNTGSMVARKEQWVDRTVAGTDARIVVIDAAMVLMVQVIILSRLWKILEVKGL